MPNVVTVYRDGDEDWDYKIANLPAKTAPQGIDSLSDDELETELNNRRFKKAELARAAQEARLEVLKVRETALASKIKVLAEELEEVRADIQLIG